jgi:hypothetical protein
MHHPMEMMHAQCKATQTTRDDIYLYNDQMLSTLDPHQSIGTISALHSFRDYLTRSAFCVRTFFLPGFFFPDFPEQKI